MRRGAFTLITLLASPGRVAYCTLMVANLKLGIINMYDTFESVRLSLVGRFLFSLLLMFVSAFPKSIIAYHKTYKYNLD